MNKDRLTPHYKENISLMTAALRQEESFDIIRRRLVVGKDEMTLFYIDGLIKDDQMQKLFMHFIGLQDMQGGASCFAENHIPHVEVEVVESVSSMITWVLSGTVLMLGSTFGDQAIVIDARTYPARQTEEPDSDRVMQGAHDGFVETLVFNTALIRRRIRDPRLTMVHYTVGSCSRTDVVICYMEGTAQPEIVKAVTERIVNLRVKSLTLGQQSLAESLIRRRWWNPFPKTRTLERPDAAAAELMEGRVLILCDTSPLVTVLPTSLFDFLQETDDFYFPPATGCYLRIIRQIVLLLALLLTPVFYLLMQYQHLLPPQLNFIIPKDPGQLPLILQLFLVEFAVDGLKLASMNTPGMLTNSLSVIGGLVLGDFAVQAGWLSGEVILYSAVVTIAGFSQQNHELGYAFKFLRMLLLLLTFAFRIWGFIAGILLIFVLIATNKTVLGGRRYLYPLIPFNGKALARLFLRLKKRD